MFDCQGDVMNKQLARILSIVLLIGLSASACGNTAVDETAVVVAADTDATTEIETPAAAVSSPAESEPAESEPAVASVETKGDTYTVANCEGGTLDASSSTVAVAFDKYTSTNELYEVTVCGDDINGDGIADEIVVTSTNLPDHESVYWEDDQDLHEDYDYDTNIYKFAEVYTDQVAHSAGPNMIKTQSIVMRMPADPTEAANKTQSTFGTIGLALNGVSFFNENAAPGGYIVDELFTFDQCSGHPQQQGVYHYHVDAVCLVRDLGGDITEQSVTDAGTTYTWIEDAGTNAGVLLGFLMDGFPVYGPIDAEELDCQGEAVTEPIDAYNGHAHCTADFDEPIFHYHVKTASDGGTGEAVFWIVNADYYGEPGTI
jgi:hypothetical protein